MDQPAAPHSIPTHHVPLERRVVDAFSRWIDEQLQRLEDEFADYITDGITDGSGRGSARSRRS